MPQTYSMAHITVSHTLISVRGFTPLFLNDLYAEAPEPASVEDGLPASTANLLWLQDRLAGAMWVDPHRRLMEASAMRLVQTQDRPEPGAYEESFNFKMRPLPFQMKIFAAARHMTNIALAPVAMGTGKTKMTLDIAAAKFLAGEIDTLCVIAPNGVHRQWIEKAIPDHMCPDVEVASHIWKPTKNIPHHVAARTTSRLRVMSFNVEAFSSESGKAYAAARKFLASSPNSMLVIDESSRIKSPKAVRTKTIQMLRQYSKVRAVLSGTPITRGLEDLYTQFAFLDPAIIGMSNFYSFRNRYCVTVPAFHGAGFGQVKITGYRNIEEFIGKIAPASFVVPKDVLGLPEKTYERREVSLSPEQKKLYTALRDELVADLRARNIKTPANAAVRLIRLQQLLSGYAITTTERTAENGEVIVSEVSTPVPSRRLEVLADVLNEHDGPAVIWCRFTNDIEDVASFLREDGKKVATYFGETSAADRAEAVRAFREGEIDYFVANPAAAGTGLDGLQVAQLAVYYSNTYAAESRWQSEDRIHRIGMRGHAHYVDLVVPDTVDELVLANLKAKGDLAKAIFDNPGLLEGESLPASLIGEAA